MDHLTAAPGPTPQTVRTVDGQILSPPADWTLVPPGDPALTRRIKAAGPCWIVQEKRGRKIFSRGLWAPNVTVDRIRLELAAERATPQFARRRSADRQRRERVQTEYVADFTQALLAYLNFHPDYAALAQRLALAVAEHATPVNSGTVARTQRIPLEQRAESAVIAWLRHQTTAYDSMVIPRIKGQRRQVRRALAQRSKDLLERYRAGVAVPDCPLATALDRQSF